MGSFFNSEVYAWAVLPALIIIARIFDVGLGTMRIIFVSRGKKMIAPVLGFFEVLIWISVISQIMNHLDNIIYYIAYAAGFAAGNFIGMLLEEKLALGMLVVRVILVNDECRMKERLIEAGFGVTAIDAWGASGTVKIYYTIIKRKDLGRVIYIINQCHSKAFYSVEDTRKVSQGIFPGKSDAPMKMDKGLAGMINRRMSVRSVRKGK